ncbi:hypothetical protein ACP4OV_006654 [Aristida adscensionis]
MFLKARDRLQVTNGPVQKMSYIYLPCCGAEFTEIPYAKDELHLPVAMQNLQKFQKKHSSVPWNFHGGKTVNVLLGICSPPNVLTSAFI